MIYVLHGANEVAVHEELKVLRDSVEPPDLREANTSVLDGQDLTPQELLAEAMSAPFLSNVRLVIVKGLLGRMQERSGSIPATWKNFVEKLSELPETTTLVFVDGPLRKAGSQMFKLLTTLQGTQVKSHPAPRGKALQTWIASRVALRGSAIEDSALTLLMSIAGQDLLALDSEIEKLSVHAGDRPISKGDVEDMVAASREWNIFAAVDAALAGHASLALTQVRRTLDDGRSVGYVLSMLHRQARLLLLAKELRDKRVDSAEFPKRLGVSGYPLTKTLEQVPRFSQRQLVSIHRLVAETDEKIKSGQLSEEVALDMLIADLAYVARSR